MGDVEQRDITLKILRGAGPYFRHVIAEEIGVRTAPELIWHYDDSLDKAFRIAELLKESENKPEKPTDEPEKEPGS